MKNELLQRYVDSRSEDAFTELVRQHMDVVYSAALRQVNGDTAAAEDVTQAVFSDLARKAPRLMRHSSLTGWLYTSTRFVAAKVRRAEQRRRAREQQAHTMNELLQAGAPESSWQDVQPILDDAMHELNAPDREAVLMRYFERRPLAEIAARFGLSENAARMRVERALDKLRNGLARRGVTSTLALLALLLEEKAVTAAPSGLTSRVSQTALTAGMGGMLAMLFWKLAAPASLKWAAAIIGMVGVATWLILSHDPRAAASTEQKQIPAANGGLADLQRATNPEAIPARGGGSVSVAASMAGADSTNKLVLHIITEDGGKPVPNVELDYWLWLSGKVNHKRPLLSSRLGVCEVPVPRDTVDRLILVSQADGFADTRLEWNVARGAVIPQDYTLRLARATAISGQVVDADGQPIAGAEVGFNNDANPTQETFPESRLFGWPFWVTAKTDAEGRWRMQRLAPETIHVLRGSASHPDHSASTYLSISREPEAEEQLLAGTHVFKLGRGFSVQGLVINFNEQPVPDAKVMVGNVASSGRRESKVGADGTFQIKGCKPGKTLITAEAEGFAATTLEVEIVADTPPIRLMLQPGKLLSIRVVDNQGSPIKGANAWLDTFERGLVNDSQKQSPKAQVNFNRKTDAEGRIVWSNAPDQQLTFDFSAAGFMRVNDIKLFADGQEHLVTLPPALTISGTVRDADTGRLLPRFRIITGWPEFRADTTNHQWSTIDRFWLTFEGGNFFHVYEEQVLIATPPRGFVFKILADGYAAHITRVVGPEESAAHFDVALQPAAEATLTFVLPDGRPAAGARFGLVSATSQLRLMPGGLEASGSASVGVTDSAGRLTVPADPSIKRVIIAHPAGYGEAPAASFAGGPTIMLQAWGRLEGTLLASGGAASRRALLFQFESGDFASISTDFTRYQVQTDDAGRFVFPKVPPGRHELVELISEGSGTRTVWSHHRLATMDIRPGETTTVAIPASAGVGVIKNADSALAPGKE